MDLQLDMEPLIANLESCRKAVAQSGKQRALRAGGRVINRAMKERAPILDRKTPGSDALEPGSLRDGNRVLVHEAEDGELEALIGPSGKIAHVARFVEFGHRQVIGTKDNGGDAKSRKRKHNQVFGEDVPAHPYLRPAYEESVEEAQAAVFESYKETIQQELA